MIETIGLTRTRCSQNHQMLSLCPLWQGKSDAPPAELEVSIGTAQGGLVNEIVEVALV